MCLHHTKASLVLVLSERKRMASAILFLYRTFPRLPWFHLSASLPSIAGIISPTSTPDSRRTSWGMVWARKSISSWNCSISVRRMPSSLKETASLMYLCRVSMGAMASGPASPPPARNGCSPPSPGTSPPAASAGIPCPGSPPPCGHTSSGPGSPPRPPGSAG